MERLRESLFPPPGHHGQRYNHLKGRSTRKGRPERDLPGFLSTKILEDKESIYSPMSIESNIMGTGSVAYLAASMTDGENEVIQVFNGEEILVGRQSLCQFQVPHPSCSNIHFRIYSVVFESCYEPLVYCEDLSMNGTFLNNRLVGKGISVLLTDGDKIEIRQAASFVFRQVPNESSPTLNDPGIEKEKVLFANSYELSPRILGAGGYGRVYMAWDIKTHRQVACKIMELRDSERGRNSNQKGWKRMKEMYMREVEILKALNHPNIMSIHKVVCTNSRFYIFENLITGGDLFSHLGQKSRFDEIEAMPIVWQILKALEYLHEKGVVHRDLKPDNILCTSNAAGARIVLTDFGSARFFTPVTRMTSAVGTIEYLAPEILPSPRNDSCSGYSKSVDLWSLGVVIYVLLSGYTPFGADGGPTLPPKAVVAKARSCNLTCLETGAEWSHVSAEAKDFIRSLICVDPRKRLTAKQAKKHKWLNRHTKELEEVYSRAVEDWIKSSALVQEKDVTLEHFNLPQSQPQSQHDVSSPFFNANPSLSCYQMGDFCFEPGSSLPSHLEEEKKVDSSIPDVPDLLFDQFTPDSPRDCRFGTADGGNDSWHMSGLYTAEEDALHDAAAGDGRLMNAMELSRQVEARREIRRGEMREGPEEQTMEGNGRGGRLDGLRVRTEVEERSRFFMGR